MEWRPSSQASDLLSRRPSHHGNRSRAAGSRARDPISIRTRPRLVPAHYSSNSHHCHRQAQKDEWEEEFRSEIKAYDKFKELQGTVIPHFFGHGSFNRLPALILSEVAGTTLYDLARDKECKVQDETLESQLKEVFAVLSGYGAVYWDQKLDNFLLSDNDMVMVVDLEQV